MSITALSGPLVSYGAASSSDYNPEQGPSLFWGGMGLLDPRSQFTYKPGQGFGSQTAGFLGVTDIVTINQVPSTISASNIAASQAPVSGTALTLVSSTAAGITVGVSIVNQSTGVAVTVLAVDGAAGLVSFGSAGTIQLWDPTKAISRNVRITTNADDTGGTYTVRGYDIYGFPMTETITGVNAGVASGVKAFKYLASVTPGGTINSTAVTVGTGDVYGLPIRSDAFIPGATTDVAISWAGAGISATTGYTAAVTTDPATATTGDVRGTYATQSASNGSRRLVVMQSPSLANISSVTGLFGVTQFS